MLPPLSHRVKSLDKSSELASNLKFISCHDCEVVIVRRSKLLLFDQADALRRRAVQAPQIREKETGLKSREDDSGNDIVSGRGRDIILGCVCLRCIRKLPFEIRRIDAHFGRARLLHSHNSAVTRACLCLLHILVSEFLSTFVLSKFSGNSQKSSYSMCCNIP